MKNKIAFVAVGQAGGNIGQLFEQKGYNVLYINTSQEDLDTLEKAKFKYHIPNGEGCNKDRRKAKQLVIDDFDQIAAEIETKIKSELIFRTEFALRRRFLFIPGYSGKTQERKGQY